MISSILQEVSENEYILGEWMSFCADKINYWKILFSRQLCSESNINYKSISSSIDINNLLMQASKFKEMVKFIYISEQAR